MPPPSTPRAETTNSPATLRPPAARRTGFTGAPKWRAIAGDQATRKPTFEGRNGASVTPSAARIAAQAPSEPSRAQEPPPSASTVARGGDARAGLPAWRSGRRRPASRASASGCAARRPAPRAGGSRRAAAARPSSPRGKTRPELPVKTSTPRSVGPAADLGGAEAGEDRREPVGAGGVGGGEGAAGSSLVRFSPDLPAIRSLRPSVGLRLGQDDAPPGRRQRLGGHQPGRAAADHQRVGRLGRLHRRR